MTDTRITGLSTTYDRDDYSRTVDYLIGDRSGGSSFKILAEEAVLGVLESVTGNVGIGTTSPARLIHVYSATDNNAGIRIESTVANSNPALVIANDAREWRLFNYGTTGDAFTIYDAHAAAFRLSIDTSGNVGVGTLTPTQKMHIYSATGSPLLLVQSAGANSSPGLFVQNDARTWGMLIDAGISDGLSIYDSNAAARRMHITTSGDVGINTTSPGYKLHVNGSVAGTSAYNNLSDARHKTNISHDIGYGLDTILAMRPARFDYIDGPADQLGFIAQELRSLVPEAISVASDGTLSNRETHIIPILVRAIQQMHARLEALEAA